MVATVVTMMPRLMTSVLWRQQARNIPPLHSLIKIDVLNFDGLLSAILEAFLIVECGCADSRRAGIKQLHALLFLHKL